LITRGFAEPASITYLPPDEVTPKAALAAPRYDTRKTTIPNPSIVRMLSTFQANLG
jgi:hypothetical protein